MIIVVETNFVLELAFRQSEACECDRLIELAADGSVELVIPACSLFEPYETLVRRSKERERMLAAFKHEVDELARSEFYTDLPKTVEEIVAPIAGSSNVYENSLRKALVSVLRVATIIPLSSNVMSLAFEFQQVDFDSISPQDAVVAASVILFLREKVGGPRFFANTNMKDFTGPALAVHFKHCDCKMLSDFTAARGLAERTLPSRPVARRGMR